MKYDSLHFRYQMMFICYYFPDFSLNGGLMYIIWFNFGLRECKYLIPSMSPIGLNPIIKAVKIISKIN